MPTAKSYTKWKSKKSGASNKRLDKLERKVQHLDNAMDRKEFDQAVGGLIDYVGSVNYLSGLSQSLAISGRDGNSLQPTGLKFRMKWLCDAGAYSASVRTIIYQDMSTSGAMANPTDILATYYLGSDKATEASYVYENKNRFHILYDKTWSISDQDKRCLVTKGFISGKKMRKISYVGTGTTAQKGALYVLNLSDRPTVFGYRPLCNQAYTLCYNE